LLDDFVIVRMSQSALTQT